MAPTPKTPPMKGKNKAPESPKTSSNKSNTSPKTSPKTASPKNGKGLIGPPPPEKYVIPALKKFKGITKQSTTAISGGTKTLKKKLSGFLSTSDSMSSGTSKKYNEAENNAWAGLALAGETISSPKSIPRRSSRIHEQELKKQLEASGEASVWKGKQKVEGMQIDWDNKEGIPDHLEDTMEDYSMDFAVMPKYEDPDYVGPGRTAAVKYSDLIIARPGNQRNIKGTRSWLVDATDPDRPERVGIWAEYRNAQREHFLPGQIIRAPHPIQHNNSDPKYPDWMVRMYRAGPIHCKIRPMIILWTTNDGVMCAPMFSCKTWMKNKTKRAVLCGRVDELMAVTTVRFDRDWTTYTEQFGAPLQMEAVDDANMLDHSYVDIARLVYVSRTDRVLYNQGQLDRESFVRLMEVVDRRQTEHKQAAFKTMNLVWPGEPAPEPFFDPDRVLDQKENALREGRYIGTIGLDKEETGFLTNNKGQWSW